MAPLSTAEPSTSQRRVTRACDNCKSRRTRCEFPTEGTNSPSTSAGAAVNTTACQACIDLGSTCTFDAPVRKRGPQPGSRKRHRPSISTSTSPARAPALAPAPDHDHSPDHAHAARRPAHRQRPRSSSTNGPSPTSHVSHASTSRASPISVEMEAGPSFPTAAARSQSASAVLRQTHRLRHPPPLPFGGVPTPLIDQLLPLYFTHVHNVWPLIYKPTFNAYTTTAPLLLSMLAIASCVTSSPSSEQDQDGYPTDRLFRMAEQSVYECRNECRLDLIQSLLLLSLRQTGCGDKQSASTYAGRACCMALNMGLHLAPTAIGGSAGGALGTSDSVEGEIRSRVYWNTYVLDKTLSEESGRPFLLTYRRTTTPLPSTDELEELETWPPPTLTAAAPSHRAAHIVPRRGYIMSCFAWTCRLGMIVEDILDLDSLNPPAANEWDTSFFSKPPIMEASTVADQLDRWREALPSNLDVKPDSALSPLPHHAIGIAWYHTSRILLHSRYIKRAPPQGPQSPLASFSSSTPISSVSARQVCAEAAQATIDVLSCLDKHQLLSVASSDILHMLSLTTLFEAFETTNHDPATAALAKTNFHQCCKWLRNVSSSWPAASSHRLFFEGLIKGGLQISDTPPRPPVPSGESPSDRPRDAESGRDQQSEDQGAPVPDTPTTPDGLRQMRRNLSISEDHVPLSTATIATTTAAAAGTAAGAGTIDSSPSLVNPSALFQLPQIYWNSLNTNLAIASPPPPPPMAGPAAAAAFSEVGTGRGMGMAVGTGTASTVPWSWDSWMDFGFDAGNNTAAPVSAGTGTGASVGGGGAAADGTAFGSFVDNASWAAAPTLPYGSNSNSNAATGTGTGIGSHSHSMSGPGSSPLTQSSVSNNAVVQSALMAFMMEAARGGQ